LTRSYSPSDDQGEASAQFIQGDKYSAHNGCSDEFHCNKQPDLATLEVDEPPADRIALNFTDDVGIKEYEHRIMNGNRHYQQTARGEHEFASTLFGKAKNAGQTRSLRLAAYR